MIASSESSLSAPVKMTWVNTLQYCEVNFEKDWTPEEGDVNDDPDEEEEDEDDEDDPGQKMQ